MPRTLSDTHQARATIKEVGLSRVLQLFRPYWRQLAFILILSLAAALIGLVAPLAMREIVDRAIPDKDAGLLVIYALIMFASPLGKGMLNVWQAHMNNKVGQGVMRDLYDRLFKNIGRQSMAFFTRSRTGEIVQRLSGDVQAVQGALTGTIVTAITQGATLLATAAILAQLNWRMALLSLALLPLILLPIRRIARLRKSMRLEVQTIRGSMSSHLAEAFGVSGALLTRLFGREDTQMRKFSGLNDKAMRLELRLGLIGRWYAMAAGATGPIATALIYLYGGWSVMHGEMTLGSVVAFVSLIGRMYEPLNGLLGIHLELSAAMGIFQRIFEYLDLKPDIADSPNARPLSSVQGRIAFRHVGFSYRADAPALKDVSFVAEPGRTLALVGPSGAGKSTLIGLIARLHDPSTGSIEIDGRDIRSVTMQSLRNQIAYVTQEPFLFHGTLLENMQFAKENATMEEIAEACRQAYIDEYIRSLPEGYDTVVGERGHRLSGGERQRIAIARAILKNPRILILDEATSHLDSRSEAYVQEALEHLMKDRTTIVIAHRLSTILTAHRILVLQEGQVIEEGTHKELLEREGLYAMLYRTQFAEVG